jgi:anti-sigma factor RsiW
MTQTTPSFRDVEKLSAYLDGQLKPSEIARLESRLHTEPELASVLQDLRQARSLLRKLPQRRAPRNFTLTPKMVGQKPPMPRTYPTFRFATVLATLLLFFTFATNFMAPRLVRTAVPYPYGFGGGGGGGDAEPELALESAPAEEPAMEAAEAPAAAEAEQSVATDEGEATVDDSARAGPTLQASEKSGVQVVPTPEDFSQQAPPNVFDEPKPVEPPIGVTVQVILAGVALLSGLVALILRTIAIRKWRAKAR